MIGITETSVQECKLDRVDKKTYIVITPDNQYENEIKIIRITHNDRTQLFKAAMLPGSYYIMSD